MFLRFDSCFEIKKDIKVCAGYAWSSVAKKKEEDSTATKFHHFSQQCMLNAINKFMQLPSVFLSLFINLISLSHAFCLCNITSIHTYNLHTYTSSTRLKLHSMGFSRSLNRTVGVFVFFILDIVDFLLCFTYKTLDFFFESEWKPCYCCPPPEAKPISAGGNRGGKMIVSERSGDYSKVVSLTRTKIYLDEISDTLYSRPSLLTKLTKLVKCFKKDVVKCCDESKKRSPSTKKTLLTVNSTVVEKLQRTPRWSDCHCTFCTSWLSSSNQSLFVNVQQPTGTYIYVLYILHFI